MALESLIFSKRTTVLMSSLLLIVVAYIDYITGNELSLSAFYLLPISLVALNLGKPPGIFVAIISAGVETMVQILWGGFYYSSVLIHFWNMGILMAIYIAIAVLVSSLNDAYKREKGLARRDFLTGVNNWQSLLNWRKERSKGPKDIKPTLLWLI